MKPKKSYSKEEILDGAKIGIEFEFYSNMENVFDTARSIAKFIGKRVVVPMSMSSLGKPKPLYHSPVTPTDKIFKLEPDYSGGKKMCELVTGPMKYSEARNIIIKMFEWIQMNGYTNDRCSIHANVSIDPNKISTPIPISQMNFAKFILSFDEDKTFQVFPKRKGSVYARSIDSIRPNKIFFYTANNQNLGRNTLTLPVDEKYYGVNFLKAEKNYLEYRYMGGKGYEKKTRQILDLINYYILHMYDTLTFNGQFSDSEMNKLKKMMEFQERMQEGYTRFVDFKKKFPDVRVGIDMNETPEVVETYWGNIKDKIFQVISTSGVTKFEFNYDTEVSRYQIKGAKLPNSKLDDFEIISCTIEGIIDRCRIFDSTLKNCRITNTEFVKNNKVISSKVSECALPTSNILNDCFIENRSLVINCEVNDGVIRNGEIGKLARISDGTMIVEKVEPVETPGNYKDESKEDKNAKNAKKTE